MLPETDNTIDTVHEHHRTTTRHYSCSGEPPAVLLFVVGVMRGLNLGWRETYRRDEKNRKVNGRIELDGSGVPEPTEAYKREDINRLLCSYMAIQLTRN